MRTLRSPKTLTGPDLGVPSLTYRAWHEAVHGIESWRTLDKIGIPKTTFYAWFDRYAAGGFDALEDRKPRPKRVWNRIPDEIRDKVIERALEQPELSPREVAVSFTDAEPSSPRPVSVAS